MSELIYRLEYNNEEKRFFMNHSKNHIENTNGYITIFESITDLEFAVFEELLYASRKKEEWTEEFVIKMAYVIIRFANNLLDRNITFVKKQIK